MRVIKSTVSQGVPIEGTDEVLADAATEGRTGLDGDVHKPQAFVEALYGRLDEIRAFMLCARQAVMRDYKRTPVDSVFEV